MGSDPSLVWVLCFVALKKLFHSFLLLFLKKPAKLAQNSQPKELSASKSNSLLPKKAVCGGREQGVIRAISRRGNLPPSWGKMVGPSVSKASWTPLSRPGTVGGRRMSGVQQSLPGLNALT